MDVLVMVENVAGNYIDNAVAAVDTELAKGPNTPLQQIRRELLMMRAADDFVPSFGRFLVDIGLENEALRQQLMEVAYSRTRALKRKR